MAKGILATNVKSFTVGLSPFLPQRGPRGLLQGYLTTLGERKLSDFQGSVGYWF